MLKSELACLFATPGAPGDDLLRAIDNLTSAINRRLDATQNLLSLIIERNKISEPIHYLWYKV